MQWNIGKSELDSTVPSSSHPIGCESSGGSQSKSTNKNKPQAKYKPARKSRAMNKSKPQDKVVARWKSRATQGTNKSKVSDKSWVANVNDLSPW